MSFPTSQERIRTWSEVYSTQGQRWGVLPSLTAHLALSEIENLSGGIGSMIKLGCGYGRDLVLFRSVFPDLIVDAIEASSPALEIGKSNIEAVGLRNLFPVDLFEFGEKNRQERYDIVFANYFLHLFSLREAAIILGMVSDVLKDNGAAILSLVSVRDRHYRKGSELEKQCYEVFRGLPWRFFDADDVRMLCDDVGMVVCDLREFTELELVGGESDLVEGYYLVAARR